MIIAPDATDVTTYFKLVDPTAGTPKTGLTITNLDATYVRDRAAAVKADLTALAAANSAHADNKAFEVDGTNAPGLYRVDWPDAAFASGVDRVQLVVNGAAIDPAVIEVELGVPEDVWAATTRTLTSTAAATTSAVSGSDLCISMAASYAATITGLTIPATWTKIWWTVKRNVNDADSAAQLQVVESNPGAGTDGVLYVIGAAATVAQQALGSLTVNQGAGTVAIALDETLTDDLTPLGGCVWDIKCLESGGACTVLTEGDARIERTVTRAVA